MNESDSKIFLGNKEYVSLPQFNIKNAVARIDTGADFGCIHAKIISTEEKGGKTFVRFDTGHESYNSGVSNICEAPVVSINNVKNSSGTVNERYMIQTDVVLGGKTIPVCIGLSERGGMKYPVLVGRKILRDIFVVDASQEFLTGKH